MIAVPAQIFSAPADARLIAASRCMPGVCGVLGSNPPCRTIRTPDSRHREGMPAMPASEGIGRCWPESYADGLAAATSARALILDHPLFRRGVRQVDARSCERCGSSPIVAIGRWLLLLLSSLLSAIWD